MQHIADQKVWLSHLIFWTFCHLYKT